MEWEGSLRESPTPGSSPEGCCWDGVTWGRCMGRSWIARSLWLGTDSGHRFGGTRGDLRGAPLCLVPGLGDRAALWGPGPLPPARPGTSRHGERLPPLFPITPLMSLHPSLCPCVPCMSPKLHRGPSTPTMVPHHHVHKYPPWSSCPYSPMSHIPMSHIPMSLCPTS